MQLPYRKLGKYGEQSPDPYITQEKYDELTHEMDRLVRARTPAAAEVRRLAELGDFSENVEYQLAKGKLRGINGAITRIEYQLKTAQIIPKSKSGVVGLGSTVTIETDGKLKTYHILGSTETDPERGVISHLSPIGTALMGKKVGDMGSIVVGKKTLAFKIISVE